MLKKTISYEDFDGNPQSKEFYFNLSAAEMGDMELGVDGGMSEKLKEMMASDDKIAIFQLFKDIILRAYGVRDGEDFIKNDELTERFSRSPAFDALVFEMLSTEDAFSDFCVAIVPKQLRSGLNVEVDTVQLPPTLDDKLDDPEPWLTEDREPTKNERRGMTRDELLRALKARSERQNRADSMANEMAALQAEFDKE